MELRHDDEHDCWYLYLGTTKRMSTTFLNDSYSTKNVQ